MRRRARLALGALLALLAWLRCGSLPDGLLDSSRFASTEFTDRAGDPLYEAPAAAGGRSRPLSADALPETLVQATLFAEDRRFFRHPGIDPLAIARAALRNLRAGGVREGGSTLTQQTVKLLKGGARTNGVLAKLDEAILALRLEHRLAKREILALYLSLAPYGNQARGAEAASRAYFGCAAANLTPAQAAFLAGLPRRPSALDPRRAFERALGRQRLLLERMRAGGALSAEAARQALAERLSLVRERRAFRAPHFVERVRAGLPAGVRRVETTLDLGLQREVEGILGMHRERLREAGASHVAVAVLRNATGEWLAWEGSGAYGDADADGGSIDGVAAPRQPGSALKPFTYALAFEHGFNPASVLPDVASHFPTAAAGILYSPRNYDGRFRGPLRARLALAGSENVPAVSLLSRLGVPSLLRLLRRAGLSTLDKSADHYGLALTMGDAEVRLDELVAAYAALARGGVFLEPRLVRRWQASDGAWRTPPPAARARILSERSAFWVADVLADAEARSFVFGRGGSLELPFRAAVKTGTSTAYRDNWTLGFTRDWSVGVWVGNFDRAPLRRSSGVTGAAPVFRDVMLAAARRYGEPDEETGPVPRPAGLVSRHVCALSGLAAGPACPRLESEWLPAASRRAPCDWHPAGGRRGVAWPAVYRAWAREQGLLGPEPALPAPAAEADDALRILSPPSGASYFVDPTLRDEYQRLPLRVAASGARRVTWFVDGREWASGGADASHFWPLRAGTHVLEAADDRGRRAHASVLVK